MNAHKTYSKIQKETLSGRDIEVQVLRKAAAQFRQVLEACLCDHHGRLGWQDKPPPAPELFETALAALRAVDAVAIARSCRGSTQIAERLHQARVAAVKQALALAE